MTVECSILTHNPNKYNIHIYIYISQDFACSAEFASEGRIDLLLVLVGVEIVVVIVDGVVAV